MLLVEAEVPRRSSDGRVGPAGDVGGSVGDGRWPRPHWHRSGSGPRRRPRCVLDGRSTDRAGTMPRARDAADPWWTDTRVTLSASDPAGKGGIRRSGRPAGRPRSLLPCCRCCPIIQSPSAPGRGFVPRAFPCRVCRSWIPVTKLLVVSATGRWNWRPHGGRRDRGPWRADPGGAAARPLVVLGDPLCRLPRRPPAVASSGPAPSVDRHPGVRPVRTHRTAAAGRDGGGSQRRACARSPRTA